MGGQMTRLGGSDFRWPVANMKEYNDRYEYHVEMPGIPKSEINASMSEDGQSLIVKGNHVEEKGDMGQSKFYESRSASFYRSFPLPADAKADGIKATSQHGVLNVRVPKEQTKGKGPKQIAVE